MVFQKITSSSLTESRFGDPFEMDEDMEILFKDGDPILDDPELRAVPITIKINAVDTACWLVIRLADKNTLRVNQKDGKYFEVYVIVPITHTTKDTQKASDIEAEVDKKLVVKSGKTATGLQLVIQLAKSIYKDDAYAIYETTYLTSTETNTTMNKPSVKFASTYEYLLGKDDDKYNRVPVRTIPKQADELIQLYTDNYDTPLPGETKRWDITAEKERKAKEVVDLAAFQKEVLPEFIALIVISPEKKAHTFVYWSGDPHDAKASVLANKIIYYKISLPDQVLKDGQLLSQKLQNIYTVLDNATKRTVPTLPSTNTTQSNTYDPMSMTDLRTLLFNLDPINPPEDIQQHTQADLKAGLDVDPNTLVGWYITQPRHSDIGYFDIKEEKLPKVEPGGNVVKDYTFQKMGGAVRADYKAYLFSDKIFPPTDITTVFTTGKSNIPLDFQSDDSIDAKKAGFTLANFKNQVAFVIRYLRSYPDIARIKIYGYTDTEGGKTKTGKDRNAILSLSRATSFYSYLQTATDLGVPPLTTDEAKKFVLSYEGKGQDAAEATANAEQIAIGTADFRFRKIAIDYDVK